MLFTVKFFELLKSQSKGSLILILWYQMTLEQKKNLAHNGKELKYYNFVAPFWAMEPKSKKLLILSHLYKGIFPVCLSVSFCMSSLKKSQD